MMKKRTIVIKLLFCIIMITLFKTHGFAGKKIYGPISESMEAFEMDMTGEGEFSQKYLKIGENSTFGTSTDSSAIYRVAVEGDKSRYISLTFDSSWIDYYTIPLLDMLDRHKAKATFFLTAFYIRAHSDSVKEILRRGHEIGNHSKSHIKFTELKEKTIIKEIEDCHNLVKSLTGIDMCLFRFPYGSYNTTSIKLLRERGYYPIQWKVDSLDWKNESAEAILKKLENENAYEAGNIILFHNGGDYTVEALETVFHELESRKLKCVKVSDLIYDNNFYIDGKGHQKKITKEE